MAENEGAEKDLEIGDEQGDEVAGGAAALERERLGAQKAAPAEAELTAKRLAR